MRHPLDEYGDKQPLCKKKHRGYVCTRPKGHKGKHHANGGVCCCCVWD
jgi:hypothetical protein